MRLFALIALLMSIGAATHFWSTAHAAQAASDPVFLNVGDSFQVSGAPVGCKVIAVSGSKLVDCRIAGTLAGSYGTRMSAKRLQVVRFKDARVAKIVFVATQHSGFKVCH